MNVVLDASALLRFTSREAGFEQVAEIFKKARTGQITIAMSAVNWSEVAHVYRKHMDDEAAQRELALLRRLNFQIIGLDEKEALNAALIRSQYKLAFADSFAASLAKQLGAKLLTADYDFMTIRDGNEISVELLPPK